MGNTQKYSETSPCTLQPNDVVDVYPIFHIIGLNSDEKLYALVNDLVVFFTIQIDSSETTTSVCNDIGKVLSLLLSNTNFAAELNQKFQETYPITTSKKGKMQNEEKKPAMSIQKTTTSFVISDVSELTKDNKKVHVNVANISSTKKDNVVSIVVDMLVSPVELQGLCIVLAALIGKQDFPDFISNAQELNDNREFLSKHVYVHLELQSQPEIRGTFAHNFSDATSSSSSSDKYLLNVQKIKKGIPDLDLIVLKKNTFTEKQRNIMAKIVSKLRKNINPKYVATGVGAVGAAAVAGAGVAYYKLTQQNKLLVKQIEEVKNALQQDNMEDAKKLISNQEIEINSDVF